MKVSVVMTTYNGEMFLTEQLESICNQSIRPDEIIVVDDNSKDNTLLILEEFKKKYHFISWVISKNNKNLGFRRNFNRAINMSSGDIIFLCDQDDVWNVDKIELYMKIFKNNICCKVVVSDFEYLLMDNGIEDENATKFIKTKKNKVVYKKNNYMNARPGWTFAFKKEIVPIFNKISSKTLELFHDEIIWQIGLLSSSLFYLPRKTGKWRRYSHSVTAIDKNETKKSKFINMLGMRYQRSKDLLSIINIFKEQKMYEDTLINITFFRCYIYMKIIFFKSLLILRNEKK